MTRHFGRVHGVVAFCAALAVAFTIGAMTPAPASAGLCGAVGAVSGWAGKACSVVTHPDRAVKFGKSLGTGHVGSAVKAITSSGAGKAALGLGALVTWVVVGAKSALNATAGIIKKTTTPQLRSMWFSAMYWRMTAIGALLTLPFLFAATAQAIVRSDLTLLSRAALGYLPLSLLAVSIAAPVTMLLLTATDQMSAVVSAAAGQAGSRFLTFTGQQVATFDPLGQSGFLKFFIALLASAAAVLLWIEMLMRDAAVYIVVLMLPLAFAAMVWPARRVWAVRIAEILVAVIVAKFFIVAILALGGAALGPAGGTTGLMIGLVLVTLAAFSPWALLRLIPLAELASGVVGHLQAEASGGIAGPAAVLASTAGRPLGWTGDMVSRMQRDVEERPDGARTVTRAALEPGGDRAAPAPDAEDGPPVAGEAPPATPRTTSLAGTAAADAGGATTNTDGARGEPTATGDADGAATHSADARAQRLPGLPDIYQHEDLSLPTFVLGAEGLPGEPLYRRQAELRALGGGGAETPAGDSAAGSAPVDGGDVAGTSDDPDPRPPKQGSDEGVL